MTRGAFDLVAPKVVEDHDQRHVSGYLQEEKPHGGRPSLTL